MVISKAAAKVDGTNIGVGSSFLFECARQGPRAKEPLCLAAQYFEQDCRNDCYFSAMRTTAQPNAERRLYSTGSAGRTTARPRDSGSAVPAEDSTKQPSSSAMTICISPRLPSGVLSVETVKRSMMKYGEAMSRVKPSIGTGATMPASVA